MAPNYPDQNGNGWKEYSKYVIKELERQSRCDEQIEKKVLNLIIDLATIKTQVILIGAAISIAGSAIATLVINYIIKKVGI
jgi:hypothetical protein